MIKIKAYANCDHAYVVWRSEKVIPNCLGFALYRRPKGKPPQIVETFVGPKDGPRVPEGTHRPSTVWPIQKLMWADFLAPSGDSIQYQVVPMSGTSFDDMKEAKKAASDWSDAVSLTTLTGAAIQPFFNRGIVSTQWVARQLQAAHGKSLKTLVNPPQGSTNKTRDFLGGELKKKLLEMLSEQQDAGGHIYASLFELNDPEVLRAVLKFAQRAHIILSDGTHSAPKPKKRQNKSPKQPKGQPFDENSAARAILRKAHVELHDRMVTGNHFSHHKFIVFTDPKQTTKAVSVWTGSTNLTYGGVCTQANNAIVINDTKVAGRFLEQWRELVKDVNGYPASLPKFDFKALTSIVAGRKVTAWFSPNPRIGPAPKKKGGNQYGDHPDLRFARGLIQNAEEGVLFLVFNPGYQGTLLNDILDLLKNPAKNAKLYIHGVANQDPTGGKSHTPLIFVHHNKKETGDADAIVLPAAVNSFGSLSKKDKTAADAMNKWLKSVEKYWKQEPTGLGMVRVHSKVVLVDPFGKHPVIITGSHNLGPKASAMNDDNMVVIENDSDAAAQYAVNIITIYNQYHWRFQQLQAAKNHQSLNEWNGLEAPWKSQASYFKGDKKKELAFWT